MTVDLQMSRQRSTIYRGKVNDGDSYYSESDFNIMIMMFTCKESLQVYISWLCALAKQQSSHGLFFGPPIEGPK